MRAAVRIIGTVVAVGVIVSSCSDEAPDDDPVSLPEATEPTDAATSSSDAESVAAIEDTYDQFWDAMITSENEVEENYDDFAGLATEIVIQEHVARIRGMQQNNIHRDGAPERTERTVVVDGSTARVEECVDEAPWTTWHRDEQLEADDRGSLARIFDLELVEGQWLISELVDMDEATLQC